MTYCVGIDVGGTKSAAVLIDGTGSTVARHWTEHEGKTAGRLVDVVLASIDALLTEAGTQPDDVRGVGVSVSGLVSRDGSTLVLGPTLGERGLALGARVSDEVGRPVIVVNDANATLYGHVRSTAMDGASSEGDMAVSLLLALGTGVGGAIMCGGGLLLGERGFAAELGHVVVDIDDQRVCKCGARGCVEQFASGRGLSELAQVTPPSPGPGATAGAPPPSSTREIVAAARDGDPWALGLLELAGTMLGRAIAILCVTLDPTTVVIAGSFGHATGEWLLPAAEREARSRWPYAHERPMPRLTLDAIGPYAAATGAALLAADQQRPALS